MTRRFSPPLYSYQIPNDMRRRSSVKRRYIEYSGDTVPCSDPQCASFIQEGDDVYEVKIVMRDERMQRKLYCSPICRDNELSPDKEDDYE